MGRYDFVKSSDIGQIFRHEIVILTKSPSLFCGLWGDACIS